LSPSDLDDEDEITFTGAWFTPLISDDDGVVDIQFIPEVYCCPT
jgi:hypothetical protein